MAAKIQKTNETNKLLTKKFTTMKKTMCIIQVVFFTALAILVGIYTIGTMVQLGWQDWHIGFVAMFVFASLLVKFAIKETIAEFKK